MDVTPTSSQTNPTNPASSLTPPGGQLGEQQFLQLLVDQLQNQDPTQPMDNSQFITQLAQFSTLQAMQSMQTTLQSELGSQLLNQAMSFLGHTVTATQSDGTPITGAVTGVQVQGGNVLLELGSTTVPLTNVQDVQATGS